MRPLFLWHLTLVLRGKAVLASLVTESSALLSISYFWTFIDDAMSRDECTHLLVEMRTHNIATNMRAGVHNL
eukprot:7995380-Pyramimonas_sp.AAC.1